MIFPAALMGQGGRKNCGVTAMENLVTLIIVVLICSTLGFLIASYQNGEWPWKF